MTAPSIPTILADFERLGMNQATLAKRLKVTQPTISRWRTGSEPKTLHRDKLLQLAKEKGLIPEAEYIATEGVQVVGYVGAGQAILYDQGQGPFGEAPMPPKRPGRHTTTTVVAVVVRGDSMAPMLQDGWTIYYDSRQEPPSDDLLGETCVVGLKDGRVLVKTLDKQRSNGLYTLTSVRPSDRPLMDQEVEWAAPIAWIRPKANRR